MEFGARSAEWFGLRMAIGKSETKEKYEPRKLEEPEEAVCVGCHQLRRKSAAGPDLQNSRQPLLRAGTSVGANYRAACRGKSTADFISKMGTVEEEADESGYWMELLVDSGKVKVTDASTLIKEAGELTAIAISSINTARKSGGRQ